MEQGKRGNSWNPLLPTMGGVFVGAAVVGALILARSHPSQNPPAPAASVSPPAIAAAATPVPTPLPRTTGTPEAIALYRRTLLAQIDIPLTAHLTVTEPIHHVASREIDLIEGTGGRYRMTYLAPADAAGRVLVSSGKGLYQYEPSRNVVIARALQPADPDLWPVGDAANGVAAPVVPDMPIRVERAGEMAVIDGRPTEELALRTQKSVNGPFVPWERRWVDRETGRSLRIDRYTDTGMLRLRIALSHVRVTPAGSDLAFQANFPKTTRVIRAAAPRVENVNALAKHLALPAEAGGLKVRSALAMRSVGREMFSSLSGSGSSKAAQPRSHHLLYSDGIRSVSVFVSPLPAKQTHMPLHPGHGWKSAPATGASTVGPSLLTRADDVRGSVAIAWLKDGRRYVAISRMPLPHLLPIVRDLYADR